MALESDLAELFRVLECCLGLVCADASVGVSDGLADKRLVKGASALYCAHLVTVACDTVPSARISSTTRGCASMRDTPVNEAPEVLDILDIR